MRRADRLFQIIQLMRTRKTVTASYLAEALEVSERTIYRDMQDLICSGVPIDSEAGIGYQLRKEYNLPPLMFHRDELISLIIGTKMVSTLGGKTHQHASTALSKINSVLPAILKKEVENIHFYTPLLEQQAEKKSGDIIYMLNQAIREKYVLAMHYRKPLDTQAEFRKVYPLGIFFWGEKWTMVAWCLLRNDFRHFRLDRIQNYQLLAERFELSSEQKIERFFEMIACGDHRE